MRIRTVITFILIAMGALCGADSAAAAASDNPNFVIEQIRDVYKFVPTADGAELDHVDYSTEVTFRAVRVPGVATAVLYYNDDIEIKSVKGGPQAYGSYLGGDEFFSDSKACLVAVELKGAGATAKMSAKLRFNRPEFFTKIFLAENYEIEKADVRFEIPVSLSDRYRVEARNMQLTAECERAESTAKDKFIIDYTVRGIPAAKLDPISPSFNKIWPQFVVSGQFADVNALYHYLYGYLNSDDPATAEVAAKAAEVTQGLSTDSERISAVNDFVHNTIRYVAVEHGELGQRPDLASEVLRKKFGDCKGSAVLIRDMLRSLGIDARLTWVGTNEIDAKWTDEPALSSGNHMIAAVMTADSTIYLDGTAKFCNAGDLPYAIQGRQALIENGPDAPIIGEIPLLQPDVNSFSANLNATLDLSGKLTVDGEITMTGDMSRALQSVIDNRPQAKKGEVTDIFFAGIIKGAKHADTRYSINDDNIVITGSASTDGVVTNAADVMYVDLGVTGAYIPTKIKTDKRKTDAEIDDCKLIRIITNLKLPEGCAIKTMPTDREVSNQWFDARVTNQYDADSGIFTRSFTYIIKHPYIKLSDLPNYNSDADIIVRACREKLAITPSI